MTDTASPLPATPIRLLVVDDHTRHLLPEDIECEALQPLQLKGIAEPVNCWRMSANLPDIDCPPAV